MRVVCDFNSRPEDERNSICAETWCDHCNQADLGLVKPVEFEEDGQNYIEGLCRKCGNAVRTYLVEKRI
jgi:hypothetical protein